jgi:dolichyl-diphosphooligosaccharide--protein glycosyltransferase
MKLLKKYFWFLVLMAVATSAFYFRSETLFSKSLYVNADDPHLAYRMAYYFKENLTFPKNDTLRLYPYGANNRRGHIIWLYVAGIFGKIFNEYFGWNMGKAIQFYPPFFGFLTTVAIFFLTDEIFKNKKIALLASLFFACLPALLYRSNSAFTDKEAIAQFFMILSFLFFTKSIKRFSLKYSLLSAISLSLMGMSWGGVSIPYLVISFLAIILILLNIFDKSFIYTYLIVSSLSISLLTRYPTYYGFHAVWLLPNYVAISIFIARILDQKIKFSRKITFINLSKYFGVYSMIFIGIFGVASIAIYKPLGGMVTSTLKNIQAPLMGGVVGSTVAENRPSTLSEVSTQLGASLGASIFGKFALAFGKTFSAFIFSVIGGFMLCYLIYKKKIDLKVGLFIIVWYLIGLYVGFAAVRALFLSGFPVSIVAAFGFYHFFRKLHGFKFKNKKLSLGFRNIIYVIITFSIFFHLYTGHVFGKTLAPSMSKNWEDALKWVKEHSEKDDVVLSWWDYGYIIQFYAQRPTYVDPGHPATANDKTLVDGKYRDQQVALFFTSTDEEKYLDWLKGIDVKYIVHDVTMIGKYSAVSKIASGGEHVDNLVIYNLQESKCLKVENGTCKKAIFNFGPITLVQSDNEIYGMLIQGAQARNVSKVCLPDGVVVVDPNGLPGCVFIAQNAVVYVGIRCDNNGCYSYDLTDSLFVQMWFYDARNLEHFEKVYDNGEVKVFEVIY